MNSILDECNALTSLDFSNFDFVNTSLSNKLFKSLNNLQFLKLSNINVYNDSDIPNMGTLFQNLNKLTFLDMSNFKIKNNTNMNNIFLSCSIYTLNLSNFDYIFKGMFNGLNYLKTLILNKATIPGTDLSYLFSNLDDLTSLDLSEFHTDNAQIISYMFNNCKKLTNLNLSSFNTSKCKK